MHNRLGKTIAENKVSELWAFLNYSNISIFLRAHWGNAVAFLFTRIKKSKLSFAYISERCFPSLNEKRSKISKEKRNIYKEQLIFNQWSGVAERSSKYFCFLRGLQTITKKSSQPVDLNW